MRILKFGSVLGAALSLLINASAFAQTVAPAAAPAAVSSPAPAPADEPQTVTGGLKDGPMKLSGWFVAPTFTTSSFAGSLSYSPGLRAGLYLNRRVAVGLAFNAVGNEDTSFEDDRVRNVGEYGGLLLQYVVESNRPVHATIESTVGTGKWCQEISDERDGCVGRTFLVWEPMANVEINVARHVRVATGVGYRFTAAGNGPGPSRSDMNSLVARTSVVFGSF